MDKKWFLFVPTWRHDKKYLYSFSTSSQVDKISCILNDHDAILIEKQHPIVLESMIFNQFNHIKVPQNIRILNREEAHIIDTQELLMACDRLITDYSSIYFDFVLMNRPVIHFTYDYEHFMQLDFGFCYDIRKYGGGPFAYSEEELLSFMRFSDDDLLKMRNEATKKELLEYVHGNSCENYYALFEKIAASKRIFSI